ncbi:MAG: hypothetical protein U0361_07830 [Nitrospiraceae bacterium]
MFWCRAIYKDPDDVQGMFDRKYENVVFNGGVFRYDPVHSKSGGHFLEAKPDERVRFYFVNTGPINFSAVHLIQELGRCSGGAAILPTVSGACRPHGSAGRRRDHGHGGG